MVKTKHQKYKPNKQPHVKKHRKQKHGKQKHGKQADNDISEVHAQVDALGLKILAVTADYNCFFRALADQLEGDEDKHEKYRSMVVQYIVKNREMFEPFIEDDVSFDEYCQSVEKDGTWAGHMELQAASLVTLSNICVYRNLSPRWYLRNFDSNGARMIHLSYHGGGHFNSVRLKEDTCNGPARPITIKADADISATSHQAKVSASKEGPGKNIDTGSIKLVMAGTACDNAEKVEQVLLELGGDVDAAIEFLIIEQGIEERLPESDKFHSQSITSYECSSGNDNGNIEHHEEEPEIRPDGQVTSTTSIQTTHDGNSQQDEKFYKKSKISSNKVCPCGSKKKYEACCGTLSGRSYTKMSCNPSSSQGTESREQIPPPLDSKRYSIHVEANGNVRGDDAKKWSSRCGFLIRSLVPIKYKEWRVVDKTYKEDLWKALMKEFDLNIPPHVARPQMEKKFPQFFRTEKHMLRKNIIRNVASKREALAKCPNHMDKVWWEAFVENEFEEKKKAQCKTNAENKAKNTITHSLGRRSYDQVYEELEKESPGVPIKRSTVWKLGHKSKTGKILPSAEDKYKQIEIVEEQRKVASASEHGGATDIDDIEHDELAEVFGPDKYNWCRAMSSTSSVKQVKFGQAAKAIAEEKGTINLAKFQAELQANMASTVETTFNKCVDRFLGMAQFRPQHSDGSMPRTEGASNMQNNMQIQILRKNLITTFDTLATRMPSSKESAASQSRKQYVLLLSGDQTEVAKGYIFEHSGVCHMRKVAPDERVVWVTEVKDPEALIYEAPQNGHSKLCEIADGGFLRWLQTRLRYL